MTPMFSFHSLAMRGLAGLVMVMGTLGHKKHQNELISSLWSPEASRLVWVSEIQKHDIAVYNCRSWSTGFSKWTLTQTLQLHTSLWGSAPPFNLFTRLSQIRPKIKSHFCLLFSFIFKLVNSKCKQIRLKRFRSISEETKTSPTAYLANSGETWQLIWTKTTIQFSWDLICNQKI